MKNENALELVLCADRRVLAGLHVTARSVVRHLDPTVERVRLTVYSESLLEGDRLLLESTLAATGRDCSLRVQSLETDALKGFPQIRGSLGTYFRLLALAQHDRPRFLYLDVDLLCLVDVWPMFQCNLGQYPAAFAAEAPIVGSADEGLISILGDEATGDYLNAGVMVADVDACRQASVTEQCFTFLAEHPAEFHDQTALNYVLHQGYARLPPHFNCATNGRHWWPGFRSPACGSGRILHYLDYPKPWSRLGKYLHPLAKPWWEEYRQTAHAQSGQSLEERVSYSIDERLLQGYKKVAKDKMLFSLYNRGWFHPKGVPMDEGKEGARVRRRI
jgi:lipopolysaccharide biosynthesis glycosyltransferase